MSWPPQNQVFLALALVFIADACIGYLSCIQFPQPESSAFMGSNLMHQKFLFTLTEYVENITEVYMCDSFFYSFIVQLKLFFKSTCIKIIITYTKT